jgi:prepilin-type N-terminal cleavage/methylation domain-containing protein
MLVRMPYTRQGLRHGKVTKNMNITRPSSGFTLVEMLVVVTIAGVLATVAYVSYRDARLQARDRSRMAQLEQLHAAIELYKDTHGEYPLPGCSANFFDVSTVGRWVGPGPLASGTTWGVQCEEYILGLVPEFMDKLPENHTEGENVGIKYAVNSTRTSYKLLYHFGVERLVVDNYAHPYARCPAPCSPTGLVCGDPALGGALQARSYAIYSVGAECW